MQPFAMGHSVPRKTTTIAARSWFGRSAWATPSVSRIVNSRFGVLMVADSASSAPAIRGTHSRDVERTQAAAVLIVTTRNPRNIEEKSFRARLTFVDRTPHDFSLPIRRRDWFRRGGGPNSCLGAAAHLNDAADDGHPPLPPTARRGTSPA